MVLCRSSVYTRLAANEANWIAYPLHLSGAGEGAAEHDEDTSCRLSVMLPSTELLWRSKEGLPCGLLFHEEGETRSSSMAVLWVLVLPSKTLLVGVVKAWLLVKAF